MRFVLRNYSDEGLINMAGGTDLNSGGFHQLFLTLGIMLELNFNTNRFDSMFLKSLKETQMHILG
jgi:hypothetical protein